MEKQEHKSNWDELVREIGVEVSPEVVQREEAAATEAPAPAPVAEESSVNRAPLPKKAAVDWNSLAGELGLPPAPPDETPPAPVVEEPKSYERQERPREVREERPREESRRQEGRREQRREREERPRREGSESRGRERGGRGRGRRGDRQEGTDRGEQGERQEQDERQERGERPERAERGERQERSERQERGEQRERGGRSEEQRDRRGRGRRRPQRESEPAIEEQVDEACVEREEMESREEMSRTRPRNEERADEAVERPAPVREEPPKSAAVSLWHKIFGSPAEQSAKLVDELQEENSVVPAEDLRDEPRDAGGFADAHVDEDIAADVIDEGFEDRADAGSEEESPGDRRRGRSRRRRGRGRGRRPESSQGEERSRGSRGTRPSSARDEDDDEFDGGLDDEILDDEPAGAVADSGVEGDDSDEALVGASGGRGRSSLRGTIPSWDEAIGFIVDTNMQSRSQRKPPSRPGGRGDGGRGRSRGRRRPQ